MFDTELPMYPAPAQDHAEVDVFWPEIDSED